MELGEHDFERMLSFLKVLADRSRLRIVGLLAEKEYTVKELAAVLGLKEPTVSEHLAALKYQDIVDMRPQGTAHHYRLKQEGIHTLLKQLKPAPFADGATFADASEFERHVLNAYFRDGRLQQIPMQHKKMLVILEFLVKEFQYGEHYSEKQVNEILKRFNPDCATLRRQLVDNRYMARANGIYWRIEAQSSATAAQDRLE
jgi:hypothetical protein